MTFDASKPDGTNDSLNSAVSRNGTPEIGQLYLVPARCGVAVKLYAGQLIKIENTHGTQVCDFWAFCDPDMQEFLSMSHTRTSLESIFPQIGDTLVSNTRQPMLEIVEDTSLCKHDTIMSCCDINRYKLLGCETYHDNCTDNLRMALLAIHRKAPLVPDPFNLWMNIPVNSDGQTSFEPAVSKRGDWIKMKAKCDMLAVMSACPQDMNLINGVGCNPTDVSFLVEN